MIDQLRDLSSTAEQLAQAWPVLIELSTHAGLKSLLARHELETRLNVPTFRRIMADLHAKSKEDRCQAMEGLLRGGEEHLVQVPYEGMRDLMMIAHCLRIQGYEIAAHSFTSYLAERCQQTSVAENLGNMLEQHIAFKRDLDALKSDLFAAANRTDK